MTKENSIRYGDVLFAVGDNRNFLMFHLARHFPYLNSRYGKEHVEKVTYGRNTIRLRSSVFFTEHFDVCTIAINEGGRMSNASKDDINDFITYISDVDFKEDIFPFSNYKMPNRICCMDPEGNRKVDRDGIYETPTIMTLINNHCDLNTKVFRSCTYGIILTNMGPSYIGDTIFNRIMELDTDLINGFCYENWECQDISELNNWNDFFTHGGDLVLDQCFYGLRNNNKAKKASLALLSLSQ